MIGPKWRAQCAETVPAGPEQAVRDVRTFFEIEVPALGQWKFDEKKAQKISQPILYVLGSESHVAFKEARNLVHSWFPRTEDCVVQRIDRVVFRRQCNQVPGAPKRGDDEQNQEGQHRRLQADQAAYQPPPQGMLPGICHGECFSR